MAAFLKVWDAQVADLQKKSKAEQQRAATQQLIRDFDEKGISGWHFAKDDIGFMCEYYILPHITDPDTRQYFELLSEHNREAAKPEDFSRLISPLVKLPKSAKAKIFARNLQDNQVSILPRQLSDRDKMYYSKEQKEKDNSTPILHRCSRSSSILPSILSAPPKMIMSNPRNNCFPSSRALPRTRARCYSSFSASALFSLAVIFSRKLPACLCRSQLPLVSLHRWNQIWHVLLLDSTICSAYISSLFDRRSPQVMAVSVTIITVVAADLLVLAVAWASSIGILNRHNRRHNHRLNRRHNRRHNSLANNRINENINDSRPMDRLPPRRHLPANNRVPLPVPKVVAVAEGTGSNGLCASLEWSCPRPTRLR